MMQQFHLPRVDSVYCFSPLSKRNDHPYLCTVCGTGSKHFRHKHATFYHILPLSSRTSAGKRTRRFLSVTNRPTCTLSRAARPLHFISRCTAIAQTRYEPIVCSGTLSALSASLVCYCCAGTQQVNSGVLAGFYAIHPDDLCWPFFRVTFPEPTLVTE